MDRQKVLLIFAGAWVSAALLTWFLYASTKAPRVEKTVAIQAATRDLPAGTRLRKTDLRAVRVFEKDVPKTAILDEKQALDRPLLFPVSANEPITLSKIASATGLEGLPAIIEPGKRAIAVPITDTSGVAGLIQPRAHVDVLFTKTGSRAEAVTTTILEDVVVLAIGRNTETTSSSTPPLTPAAAQAAQTARPPQSATLLVTPEQSRKLELAKNEGKISLALRNPLDHSAGADGNVTTSDALYANLPPGKLPVSLRTRAPDPPRPPAVQAPPAEVKPDPPKPKKVIEVFRGDKHVQESFE